MELGTEDCIQPFYDGGEYLLEEKGALSALTYELDLAEGLTAPVAEGQKVGTLTVRSGERELTVVDILSDRAVERLTFGPHFPSAAALGGMDEAYIENMESTFHTSSMDEERMFEENTV